MPKTEYKRKVVKNGSSFYINIPDDLVKRMNLDMEIEKREIPVIIKPGARFNQFSVEVLV
ncbi:MAG: hypothetical protein NZ992_00060 [Candidatus Korarchaeum sp.]|nr:hypothetical protein [Candidatus Korarchaeum sp.]MDW8093360.1 hypothetical protein [Nitrososphaerota archaeon]